MKKNGNAKEKVVLPALDFNELQKEVGTLWVIKVSRGWRDGEAFFCPVYDYTQRSWDATIDEILAWEDVPKEFRVWIACKWLIQYRDGLKLLGLTGSIEGYPYGGHSAWFALINRAYESTITDRDVERWKRWDGFGRVDQKMGYITKPPSPNPLPDLQHYQSNILARIRGKKQRMLKKQQRSERFNNETT